VFCYLTRADDRAVDGGVAHLGEDSRRQEGQGRQGQGKATGTRAQKEDTADDEGDQGAKTAAPVRIDLADIHLRVCRLTSLPGDERAVAIHPQGTASY